VSGFPRRAAGLVLPLVAAGLFAAACGSAQSPPSTGVDQPASGASGPTAGTTGPTGPTGTAGPPSGIPAPTGIPVTPPGSTGTSGPGAGTHQLGPADNGRTVTLKVGEMLQIQLPSDKLAAGRWTLIGWPKDAVAPKLNSSGLGRFAFRAQAAGSGRITFARFVCNTALTSPCDGVPLPGPKFAPEPPGGKPAGWSVTVQVV
jgi:hypothetical protein